MCIIASFTRAHARAHLSETLQFVRESATSQPHGLTLLTQDTCYRAMTTKFSISTASTLLTAWAMGDEGGDRIWLHFRWGTGGSEVLAHTHGWQVPHGPGEGWFVLHNGILSGDHADSRPVDSMAIWDVLHTEGPEAAVAWCQSQGYANVFLVHPASGAWLMTRSQTGSLYQSEDTAFDRAPSCYASVPLGAALLPVPHATHERFAPPSRAHQESWASVNQEKADVFDLCIDLDLCRDADDVVEVLEGYHVRSIDDPLLCEALCYVKRDEFVWRLVEKAFARRQDFQRTA